MKKFISVALVASMVASMGVTAFADTKYPYKDKELEFHDDFFYDGKGADEIWIPIVVKKGNNEYFITDGGEEVDKDDAVSNAISTYIDARSRYNAYQTIVVDATGKNGIFDGKTSISEIDEAIAEQLALTNDKVLQVSHVDINGDAYTLTGKNVTTIDGKTVKSATYYDEVVQTYTKAVNAAKAAMQSQVDIIALFGGKTVADMAAEVIGWGNDKTEASKIEIGNPPTPLKRLGHVDEKGNINPINNKNDNDKYVIAYDEIEDVNDVEISLKVKRGKELVADYSVDEVDELGGIYCVVIEMNDNLGIGVAYMNGTLKMETGKNKKLDEQDIRYNYYNPTAYSVLGYQQTVGDLNNGYVLEGGDNYIDLVDFNENYHTVFFKKNAEWVEIEDSNSGFYYEVDVVDQGQINLTYNNTPIDIVTDTASEDAILTFYNFEARPVFDFSGKVIITPPDEYEDYDLENLYVYTYQRDGSLKRVKQAKVGEDGDTIEFRTNELGKFVLSTEEITLLSDAERAALEAMKEEEAKGEKTENDGAVVEENKQNPGTGL